MSRLIVICEGGVHTVDYLYRNGVFPGAIVLEPSKFQEMIPYLTIEDEILLIIKGLTDFKMTEIYSLLSKFDEHREKVKDVTILSNIMLGSIPYAYYYYKGDLFYGKVQKVIDNKKYSLDTEYESTVTKKNNKNISKKINPVMFKFKEYNKNVKLQIYGREKKEICEETDTEILKGVVYIDLFKENKNNEKEEGVL